MRNQAQLIKMGSGLNGSIDEERTHQYLSGNHSANEIHDIRKHSNVFNSAKNSVGDDTEKLPVTLNPNQDVRQSANIVTGGSQNLMIQDDHALLLHAEGAQTLGISVLEN